MADPVYLVDQVKTLDAQTIAAGTPASVLMAEAGLAAYHCLLAHWPRVSSLIVFCGPGNNGGDGYVLARLAVEGGLPCTVIALAAQKHQQGAAFEARQSALQAGVIEASELAACQTSDPHTVYVDAMLGAGFRGQLRHQYAEAATLLSSHCGRVLALDIPSGLNADSGVASQPTVRSTVTITFIGQKLGLLTGEGPAYCGNVTTALLSVPDEVRRAMVPTVHTLSFQDVLPLCPRRTASFHKGSAGKAVIIAGDAGMGGAAILATESAARSGAGTVNLFTAADHVNAALARCPTAMVTGVRETATWQEASTDEAQWARLSAIYQAATAIVAGPGLGLDAWGQGWLSWLLCQPSKPLVLDADALNLIAASVDPAAVFKTLNKNGLVITPHPGEAARLLNCRVTDVQHDRLAAVSRLVDLCGGVVILKGAGSLLGWRDSAKQLQVQVCLAGNPGMASGGMGDVLSGLLGSLIAQGLDVVNAARLGCCIHSEAADRLAVANGKIGLLAYDLPPMIRQLINTET